jgi:AraC-like DNA-binding protein
LKHHIGIGTLSNATSAHPQLKRTALDGVQLLLAPHSAYRYDRHVHDTYSFGLTYQGVQSFTCRGEQHHNTAGRLIAFNPDEAHDGSPGLDASGFAYAMLWVTPEVLAEHGCSRDWAHFRQATFDDPTLAQQFAQLINSLSESNPNESLQSQELISAWLAQVTSKHGRLPAAASPHAACMPRALRMRDYLRAHSQSDICVEDLALEVGVSRVHATRLFTQAWGIAPHEYLKSLRVIQAKSLIAAGLPLAEVATVAGFTDQAHMSKRFKAAMGMSPGRYKAMLLN